MDERQSGRLNSPLRTERGSTMIEDKVVVRIANKTAGEVEGVRMIGDPTLQKQLLCAPFQQFVRSSVRKFESFQTVSLGSSVNRGNGGIL